MRYLQRFATKCETNAFFGPVAKGEIADEPARVAYECDLGSYQGTGFASDRLLLDLVRLLRGQSDLLLRVDVKRCSGVTVGQGGTVSHPRAGTLRLDWRAHAILRAAGEPTRVAQLVAPGASGSAGSLEQVRGLLELGLLTDELDCAWSRSNPLRSLRAIAEDLGVGGASERDFLRGLDEGAAQWPAVAAADRIALADSLARAAESLGLGCGHGEVSTPTECRCSRMASAIESGFGSTVLGLHRSWWTSLAFSARVWIRMPLAVATAIGSGRIQDSVGGASFR